jgi:hypothetical protein
MLLVQKDSKTSLHSAHTMVSKPVASLIRNGVLSRTEGGKIFTS